MDQDFKERVAHQIGHNLRTARLSRMLSVEELAEHSCVTARHITEYESGQRRITVDELERVASALRLPISHFFAACVLCGGKHCTGS